MPKPQASAALQQFVESELLRMPVVLESSIQPTLDSLQRAMVQATGSQRPILSEVILRLSSQRPRVVARYVDSLREQATREMLGQARPAEPGAAPGLSLVDDDEVAVDVVISHAIETIRSVAEHELREALAFTSALAGDMDVTADHNPLRAESQARALWAAAGALPLSRNHQVAFVRHAAAPLAQALRKAYAAACARLEEQGVTPAAYRTVVPPAGARSARTGFDGAFSSLTLPGPLAAPAPAAAPDTARARPYVSQGLPGPVRHDVIDAQTVDRLSRLFAQLLADRSLPSELHAAISRLQGIAAQTAAADPRLLDQADHPLWRLIDQLAHLGVIDPGPDGTQVEALAGFLAQLVDQMAAEPVQTRQLHEWALQQLQRFVAARLSERIRRAGPQIQQMQQLEQRLAGSDEAISTFHGALDIEHLDTVPADLIDQSAPAQGDAARWLLTLQHGDWLRLFRKGSWRDCQLLWSGDRGELWLFADDLADEPWAIRRSALQLLREERLVGVQRPAPRVQAAMTAIASRR